MKADLVKRLEDALAGSGGNGLQKEDTVATSTEVPQAATTQVRSLVCRCYPSRS